MTNATCTHEQKTYTEDQVLELWHRFEDVPMNEETEQIEEPFMHFPTGTGRFDIWEWFDANWPRGVFNLIYEGGQA